MRIGEMLVSVITLYQGLILLRAVLTWFVSPETTHSAIDLLKRLTDPVLDPVRKALPATGTIDFAPLVVLIGLELLKRFLT